MAGGTDWGGIILIGGVVVLGVVYGPSILSSLQQAAASGGGGGLGGGLGGGGAGGAGGAGGVSGGADCTTVDCSMTPNDPCCTGTVGGTGGGLTVTWKKWVSAVTSRVQGLVGSGKKFTSAQKTCITRAINLSQTNEKSARLASNTQQWLDYVNSTANYVYNSCFGGNLPTGLGGTTGAEQLCTCDCATVKSRCPPGTNSCTACWMLHNTNTPCDPNATPRATLTCPTNPGNYVPGGGGGGTGGTKPCVSDCACVRSKCGAGNVSCSACWMRQGTNNQPCNPNSSEKATYTCSNPAGGGSGRPPKPPAHTFTCSPSTGACSTSGQQTCFHICDTNKKKNCVRCDTSPPLVPPPSCASVRGHVTMSC